MAFRPSFALVFGITSDLLKRIGQPLELFRQKVSSPTFTIGIIISTEKIKISTIVKKLHGTPYCSQRIIWVSMLWIFRFLHKDFLFQIETSPGVFSRDLLCRHEFEEKYWEVWKFLRKMPGCFYVIRHIMAAFYVLAGRLRIQVPSRKIRISLVWVEIS